ncbi:Zinc cluster transcription factor czf1 [Sporothrix curviconia]|uniref:Zinc cluster transcription factor czf1 n=1 Tax=Sporothrix curviconia TaxID=1260050 RepID=A0ABP0AXB7_9PEZI
MLTRPRLRTKTGCLTCRRRRKKCCEKRPRCHDCTRHGLECIWPESAAAPSPSAASTPASVLPATAATASPEAASPALSAPSTRCSRTVARRPRRYSHSHSHAQSRHCCWPRPSVSVFDLAEPALVEANLLHHFAVGFMPLLVRAEAHPGFRNVSYLSVATGSRPWMRALFASLAALHLGQGTPAHQAVADGYYHTALAACCDCGERLDGQAAKRLAMPLRSTKSTVDRIAAESFLYHVAIVSIVDPDLDIVPSKFSWADVDEGLGYNPFPSASEAANSPVLGHGGAPSVYRMAFEVTRLGRHWPLVLYDRLEAAQLQTALGELKAAAVIEDNPGAASPTVRLYLLAIEIYLLRLLDGSQDNGISTGSGVFVTSSDLLIALWRTSYCGYVRRIALVVERVWTWRTWSWMEPWTASWQLPGMVESEGIRDGLCLLTQEGGLARFLNAG